VVRRATVVLTILSKTHCISMPGGVVTDQWGTQMQALGAFIRSQRKLANLSLRQLAELSTLSNPHLIQLGPRHAPAIRPRAQADLRGTGRVRLDASPWRGWSGWRRAPPSDPLGGYAQIREY
jgi:hypothetical protein